MVGNHPAKFGGNKHCGNGNEHCGDVMFLICHVMSQDHLTQVTSLNWC